MTTTLLSAKEIFTEANAINVAQGKGPNPRTLRSLENIVAACEKLESHKQRISICAVAMLTSATEGGPTYGGLRNSKLFKAYVSARVREQVIGPKRRSDEARIAKTGNPQVDADIAAMAALNAMLTAQVRCMTKALQGLGQYEIPAAIERGELALAKVSSRSAISQEAIDAINALTDPSNLDRCGLSLAGTGQIVNSERRSILLKATQLSALRALLS